MASNNPEGYGVSMGQSMMVDSFTLPACLTPEMDIFAAGYFKLICSFQSIKDFRLVFF